MRNPIIEKLLAKSRRTDIPKFGPGDTIKVLVKIREGEKERLQAFEGVVIARKRGAQPSFTVRKISFGQGVERIFPIDSKVIDKIDVVRSAKVLPDGKSVFIETAELKPVMQMELRYNLPFTSGSSAAGPLYLTLNKLDAPF